MITLLTGDNSFGIHQALAVLVSGFDGTPEKIDGSELTLRDLPDLLMGSTLFAEKRLVIIKDISRNTSVWEKLPDWLGRISDDIHLVLIDSKPDKRTVSYKELKKVADIQEFTAWTDRDQALADDWVLKQATEQGLVLDKKLAHQVVERVGFDQWQLGSALDKLALVDTIDSSTIEQTIDSQPSENVFNLLETALKGQTKEVHVMLKNLELTEDPYTLFGLLSSQVFQLAAIAHAGPDNNPAKDLAIHPYVVSKLSGHAKRIGKTGANRALKAFARTDSDMKLSKAGPWLLIERALLVVATS